MLINTLNTWFMCRHHSSNNILKNIRAGVPLRVVYAAARMREFCDFKQTLTCLAFAFIFSS